MDERTKKKVTPIYANWTTHPNNPLAKAAAATQVAEPAE
jgi:dihydropyrimidine dehydrogenase (NAD+) subunit PreA